MRLVHFSHLGLKRFGVLLRDYSVLDLTHFFRDESALRSAGEDGTETVRGAVERAHLRRSVGGHIYSLDDIVLEHPCGPTCDAGPSQASVDDIKGALSGVWASQLGSHPWKGSFGVHIVQKMRSARRYES